MKNIIIFKFIETIPIQRQTNIDNTKDISSENLNQAVSTLGAFLGVRDFTYRVANDLEVKQRLSFKSKYNICITNLEI